MTIEILNKKSLSEIKEEKEMQKNAIQADIFEVVAMLYEEVEELRARVEVLEGGAK